MERQDLLQLIDQKDVLLHRKDRTTTKAVKVVDIGEKYVVITPRLPNDHPLNIIPIVDIEKAEWVEQLPRTVM